MEYPGRIQLEHVEEIKCDHFYEGLNLEYWQMLAHKVDGENPTGYSDLLLAAQKQNEHTSFSDTREFVSLPVAEWQLCFHSWIHYSRKKQSWRSLKSKAIRGRRGWVFSWKGYRNLKRALRSRSVCQVNCSFWQCGWVVSKTNQNCFVCGSSDHLMRNCLKGLSKTTQTVSLNAKEGMTKMEGQATQKPVATQQAFPDKASWA